jgi:hypothetical protein
MEPTAMVEGRVRRPPPQLYNVNAITSKNIVPPKPKTGPPPAVPPIPSAGPSLPRFIRTRIVATRRSCIMHHADPAYRILRPKEPNLRVCP